MGDIDLARRVTDKFLFKEWLREQGYECLVVPTLSVYDNTDEFRDMVFQKDTILKPTHLSGSVVSIRAPRQLATKEIVQLEKCLRTDYYRKTREKTYKNIRKRLIHEYLLLDTIGNIPLDYKFFMCLGKPLMVQVDIDRFTNHTRQFYSLDWKLQDFRRLKYPRNPTPIDKPKNLDAALDIAAALSSDFPLWPCGFVLAA